jgi:hypothetical protein
MKKIAEIDSAAVYARTGVLYDSFTLRKRWQRPTDEWIRAALTPAQLTFVKDRNPVFRPRPRHNPTIELFIDETVLDHKAWCMLHLLF